MRLRTFILAFLLAIGFYLLTTHHRGGLSPARWAARQGRLEITEAAGPEGPADAEEQNNINVYRRNIPAVVNITSRAVAFDFFYGLVPQEGQGSGFIIDSGGHILTNYHVIADARQVQVTMRNRKQYRAQIVGTDPAHDLAVVQIDAPNLVSATLGDSQGLQVGQKVYAIGNPF
jgi:S1-C subfamily serine protease